VYPVVIDQDEMVVLVDANGQDIGFAPKLQAHIDGLKHRAISVLIKNDAGKFLLQKRYSGKYHSGGLWTNACCSHPRPGEQPLLAAVRRLQDEMGFTADLAPLFIVEYRAQVGALIEDEYAHVFGGTHNEGITPDPLEVEGYRWVSLEELEHDMRRSPHAYTAWFLEYMRLHRLQISSFLLSENGPQ
jgi:isopentenyl-diphosphate delta-isomerase